MMLKIYLVMQKAMELDPREFYGCNPISSDVPSQLQFQSWNYIWKWKYLQKNDKNNKNLLKQQDFAKHFYVGGWVHAGFSLGGSLPIPAS